MIDDDERLSYMIGFVVLGLYFISRNIFICDQTVDEGTPYT